MPIEYKGIESHKKILSSGTSKASQVSKKVASNLARDGKKRRELENFLSRFKKVPKSEQKRIADCVFRNWDKWLFAGGGVLGLHTFFSSVFGSEKSVSDSFGKLSYDGKVVFGSGCVGDGYCVDFSKRFSAIDKSDKAQNEKLREKVVFLFDEWWRKEGRSDYFINKKEEYDLNKDGWFNWAKGCFMDVVAPSKGNLVSPFFWDFDVSDFTTPWAPVSVIGEIYAYRASGTCAKGDVNGADVGKFDAGDLKDKVLSSDSEFDKFGDSDLVDVGPALREGVIAAGDNYREVCLSGKSDKDREEARRVVLSNVLRWMSAVFGASDGFCIPGCGWLARKYVGKMGIKNVNYLGVKFDKEGKCFVDWKEVSDFDLGKLKSVVNFFVGDKKLPYLRQVMAALESKDDSWWGIVKNILRGNYAGVIGDAFVLIDRNCKVGEDDKVEEKK